MSKKLQTFMRGFVAGIPVGLGYFAVAFSLGIVAKKAGLTAWQGFVASLFNLASAGEYALFEAIGNSVTIVETVLATLVVNARYLLMSCALSQRFPEGTGIAHRLAVGFGITDELFGLAVSRERYTPIFSYGAFASAIPLWSFGTFFGVLAGSRLPARAVSALSVSLYGMFIAIIVPPAKRDSATRTAILASFLLSFLFSVLPLLKEISSGTRTIVLTVLISAAAAVLRPIKPAVEPKAGG